MIPVRTFAGRSVAVFGLARSGLAAARALVEGGARVIVADDNPDGRAKAAAEGFSVSDLGPDSWSGVAALVLSPGVPLYAPRPHRVVEQARAAGVPVIGDVELFAQALNALSPSMRPKVIGVTGTNGKSTTTALIGHILAASGRDVRIGGNIGHAVLDLKPLHAGAYYVLELSSYQLDLTQTLRCDVAIFLNLTPDHLDRHGTMDRYLAAKMRIFDNQGAGDWAVVGVDDPWGARVCTELKASARTVAPISSGQAVSRGIYALGGRLVDGLIGRSEPVMSLADATALPGAHNAQNIAAAFAACRAVGLSARDIAEGMASFPGLAHRLERAGTIAGVHFINDSKATNAAAAAQALAAFPQAFWLAGGRAKEGGIASLERFWPTLGGVFLYGEAGGLFHQTLVESGPPGLPVSRFDSLDQATRAAFSAARRGEQSNPVVLLSPACASFDQYTDYEARGDAFKAIVAQIANAEPEAWNAA